MQPHHPSDEARGGVGLPRFAHSIACDDPVAVVVKAIHIFDATRDETGGIPGTMFGLGPAGDRIRVPGTNELNNH